MEIKGEVYKQKDNNENKKIVDEKIEIKNDLEPISNPEFDFIINRSKKVKCVKTINNPIKAIEYAYSREESYSDEKLYYLTQLIDNMNQYKYINSLINKKQNSNFKVYDSNFITQIDALFEYELFKNEIHDNKKAYNVHEHRKIPYDEEIRHEKRRNYKFEEKNNIKNTYENRRSVSYDRFNKYNFKDNWNTDIEKNKDKIPIGFNNEYKSNNADNRNDHKDKSMDKCFRWNKENKKKDYCSGLTSYDPFHKKKKKTFKEDLDDDDF